jgi:hypothetical protein
LREIASRLVIRTGKKRGQRGSPHARRRFWRWAASVRRSHEPMPAGSAAGERGRRRPRHASLLSSRGTEMARTVASHTSPTARSPFRVAEFTAETITLICSGGLCVEPGQKGCPRGPALL